MCGVFVGMVPGVRQADELAQLYRSWPALEYGSNSIPHWKDVRERTKGVFSDVALWKFTRLSVAADGQPERVMAQMVSSNYFSVLGVGAAHAIDLPPPGTGLRSASVIPPERAPPPGFW